MKLLSIALAVAAVLIAAVNARAWLGDTKAELIQRYGPAHAVEQSTNGSIPTNKDSYVELRDTTTTNAIWMAPPQDGYYLELIEKRERASFNKSGTNITVYLGTPNEKYDGVDFTDKSAREVIDSPLVWQTNATGDKVAYQVPFTTATIDAWLNNNKGNTTWSNEWQTIQTPGRFIKWSVDKTRQAVAYGISTDQVFRLEIKMVNPLTAD